MELQTAALAFGGGGYTTILLHKEQNLGMVLLGQKLADLNTC